MSKTTVNLLPDIKQERLKAQRLRRLMVVISLVIIGAAVAVPVLLFTAVQTQEFRIGNAQEDIKQKKQELSEVEDLQKILTVQESLVSLPNLYTSKTTYTDFFSRFSKTIPSNISLNQLNVGDSGALEINGTANSYEQVKTFFDSLIAAGTKKPQEPDNQTGYFTGMELETISGEASDEGVTFSISGTYNSEPVLAGQLGTSNEEDQSGQQ